MKKYQQGKIVVTKVSELLLCLVGNETAEFGLLKAKVSRSNNLFKKKKGTSKKLILHY